VAQSHEGALDRETEERRAVQEEIANRLHQRGIDLDDSEFSDQIVELLSAVEEWERAVQARGGDLMVDEPPSRQPDHPGFSLPRRADDESISAYVNRVRRATEGLRGS
jgi:hypothetical protein